MRFDPEKINEEKARDFDKTWNESKNFIRQMPLENRYPGFSIPFGKPHPVYETVNRLRQAYMRMGFTEMMNPLIVDEKDVHKQFGSEALAVLDRCFYLAGLPRPNVGISDQRIDKIKEILGDVGEEGIENIRQILHLYKKGKIEGDDLISEISEKLNVSDSLVVEMIECVFPEFKEIKPVSTTKTLRSHMTSGWFITLSNILERKNPPFYFFSVDRCFRREQQEDASRLMTYYSASCVIMDEDVTVEHGKAVAESLLSQFGFEKFMFRPDSKRSKYYAPNTQIEVYAYHPKLDGNESKYKDGWIEVATFGVYSPCALSEYNIPMPVMNLGLGVERLAMILYDAQDMRSMTYSQFPQYGSWVMKDSEIVREIKVSEVPKTNVGRMIAKAIVDVADRFGNEISPCSFEAWSGFIGNRFAKVFVTEPEENSKLCGPAAWNEVVVYNGDILGIADQKKWKKAFENDSARTGIRFIDAFSLKAASEIEKVAETDVQTHEIRVRMVKMLSEINLKLSDLGQKYITGTNKKTDIRGPVFTTVRVEFEKNEN